MRSLQQIIILFGTFQRRYPALSGGINFKEQQKFILILTHHNVRVKLIILLSKLHIRSPIMFAHIGESVKGTMELGHHHEML
jgi:hypothetical protein